jgi:hypothetical protein
VGAANVLARLVSGALFAAATVAFTLPMTMVSADTRVGSATGLELARGAPVYSGAYARPGNAGTVEQRLRRARVPALLALAAAAVGVPLALLAPWGALAAAAVGLAGLGGVFVATASPFVAVATDRRYGFWVTAVALVGAGVWALGAAVRRSTG